VTENRSAGIALNERAMESLEFIRTTMARSAPFTAVSGRGGMAMGVLAGSSSSVPVLAWMGALFMVLGGASLFTPAAWRDLWLGAGFGVLQIGFGAYIARNHGG
jgi:hypothetical protein